MRARGAYAQVMTCWFITVSSMALGAAAAGGGYVWLSPLLFLPVAVSGIVGATMLGRGGRPDIDRFADDVRLSAAHIFGSRPQSRPFTKWLWTAMLGIAGSICTIAAVAQFVDLVA